MPLPSNYHQALNALRNHGSRYDPEIRRLLDELATRKETLGENHPKVVDALKSVVQRCRCLGMHQEAEPFGKRALQILEVVHGKYHVEVAEQLTDLAFTVWKQEKYGQTERYYQRIISIYETKLAPDDLRIARAKRSLGSCYYEQYKYNKAEKLFQQALEIYKLKPNPSDALVTPVKELLDTCKKNIEAEKLKKRKKNIAKKRTSDALDADGKSTKSHVGPVAAKTAKIENAVGPRATPSAALDVESTAMSSSLSDGVVPLSLIERVMADARAKIIAEIDGIAEVKQNSHFNLKQNIEESQAEKVDQNENGCTASQTIKGSKSSQSRYEQSIAGLETKLHEKAQQLSSSEKKIKSIERLRQVTLAKSAKLESEISEKTRRLSEAKATIESSERTIVELKAEIAKKSSELAEAKRTIESIEFRITCSICMNADANRMWSTCRHVVTCQQCATDLLYQDQANLSEGVVCPKCRTPGFPLEVFI